LLAGKMPIFLKVFKFVMEDKILGKLYCALIMTLENGWANKSKANIIK
jgi:hypothetical protein